MTKGRPLLSQRLLWGFLERNGTPGERGHQHCHGRAESSGPWQPETVSEKLGSGEGDGEREAGPDTARQGKVKPSKEAADLRFLAGCLLHRLRMRFAVNAVNLAGWNGRATARFAADPTADHATSVERLGITSICQGGSIK